MSKKKHGIRLKDFVEAYSLEDRVDEIKNVLKEWRDKHISQITQYIEEEDKDFLVEFYELSERSIESQEPQESKKISDKASKSPKQPPKKQPPKQTATKKQEPVKKEIKPEPKTIQEPPIQELPKVEPTQPKEDIPPKQEEKTPLEINMESKKEETKQEESQKQPVKSEVVEPPKEIPKTELPKEPPKEIPKKEKKEKPQTQTIKKEPVKPAVIPKEESKEEIKIIEIPEVISVRDFAELLKISANQVVKELFQEGILITINQNIDPNLATKIAEKLGFLVDIKKPELQIEQEEQEEQDPSKLKPRPPVVVVMGHVDHGKTTLLDTIRKTNVAAKEKGGITQHIGASMVKTKEGKLITFLDTPGHEAFTSLRARGAQVTDVAILVVAADDGVMPQTIEAINHAKAFNVPIVVAVNKIDKPGADPSRVRRELSEVGVIPEEWGGDTVFVDVSAKTGQGVDELLEMVMLVADMLELKANTDKKAKGTIIESKLDKQRGPVATVLITEGTLKVGDIFVVGATYGRVRAMTDSLGHRLKQATPSTAVEIIGFEEVPESGDILKVVDSEKQAKELAQIRKMAKEQEKNKDLGISLEDVFKKIQEGEVKELKLIVKADAVGSLEAIKKSLSDIKTTEVSVKVIHEGVGSITEGDVMLARAAKAIILGFNVRPDIKAKESAEREKVDIKVYGIIYELLDDVKKAISGMLAPIKKEVVLGVAEVRATFRVKGAGTVAGCYVLDGKIVRNQRARLIREGVVIFEGKIESLKRFKEDVPEVARGYECGIKLENYNDIKVKDEIECYELKEEKQTI